VRTLAYGLALLGCLAPGVIHALGLGDIEVDSALNQPLKARIELVAATPAELNSLRVRLASPEVFAEVGLDRPFYLTELQFNPVVQDGIAFVDVTTRQSVREPFLNFLVEVSWSSGRLLREYTVLLDPPLFVEEQRQVPTQAPAVPPQPAAAVPPPVARPQPIAPPPSAAVAPAPTAPSTMERLPTPAPAMEPQVAGVDGIAVQRGDTLWSLATRNRPDSDVTVEQMMMALLRANPEAFGNDNINNLKRGFVLRVPDRGEIESLTTTEAFDAVQQQHALWREYRAQLAGDAIPQQVASDAGDATGTVGGDDAEAGGRLEILGAGGETGDATVLAQADTAAVEEELALTRQTLEARRQENEELQTRVMELEQILSDKDRLLELKDDELAELQSRLDQQATMGEPQAVSDEVVEEPAEIAAEPAEAMMPEEPVVDEPVVEEAPPGEPVSEDFVEEPAELASEPGMDAVEPAVGEESVMEPPVAEEVVEPEPAPVVEPEPVAPPVAVEPPPQPSFFEDLTSRPNFLAIAGIGVLLVVLVLVLIARRMRKGSEPEEVEPFAEPELSMDEAAEEAPLALDTGAPAEDLRAAQEAPPESPAAEAGSADVELVTGEEAPAAAGDEIESDDTTAEADVYLAYGLHQQAEELLKGALASNPDKDIYRLKLLETHFATKDKAAFESMAQELHDRLGGRQGLMWSRAVVMGQEISPDNPLFSGADVSGLSPSDFTPKRPEATDLDLSLGEDLEPSPELDIGIDDSEQPTGELPRDLDFGSSALDEAAERQVDEALDSLDTETAPQPGGVEETAEIEFDLSELDVSSPEEPAASDESTDVNVEFGNEPETEEASSPTAFEAETEEVEMAPASETMEVDVSDLDLSQATQETQELEAGVDTLGMEDEGLIAGGDEVSTKLDLAKAYIDMGDSEGARSTLEEVISEGNEEQRREAEDLMKQIA
jgi:pilus assembly protein FimV